MTTNEIKAELRRLTENANVNDLNAEGLMLLAIQVLINEIGMHNLEEDIRMFSINIKATYEGKPRLLPPGYKFRIKKLDEEYEELKEAYDQGDLKAILHESIDVIYMILGNLYLQGLPFYKGWQLVHQANMTKKGALVGGGYRAVKGARFKKPDMGQIL